MRKILLNIALLALIFSVGCSSDDDNPFVGAAGVGISSDGLTELDTEVTLNITATNIACTEITISGDATGTVAITNGEGLFTVSSSVLGISAIDDEASFTLMANSEGTPTYSYSVTVEDPISVEDPGLMHSADNYYFKWAIEPVAATVSDVKIETKVNIGGTYSEVLGTFNPEDSLALMGTDYAIDVDTIYVKVTATAGTKTSTKITKLTVVPYTFENVTSVMLDATANLAFDLIEGRYVESTLAYGDSADLELTMTSYTGGYSLGFMAYNNAEFIASNVDVYNIADIVSIEATDFTGFVTGYTNLQVGEVYIFRTFRGSDDYSYGILKVTAVEKPQGVMNDSYLEFDVKY